MYTRKIIVLICLSAASIGYLQADPMTAAQAFAEGKALGQGATGAAAGNITNGTIANTVNGFNPQYYQYSTTAPETQYFQGGNGDTYTPGTSKITSCANDPANPDKFLQQNCDAINYMARNPTTRPQFTINPNDPMILNSRQITANAGTLAAQSLGFADPSAMGSFTACQTSTTSTSPTYITEVCNEYLSTTENMCTVGRSVVVDAQSNFQCNETARSYESLGCRRGVSVAVGFGQCTPGAWLGRAAFVDCSWCVDPYMAMNVFCGGNGQSYEVEPYRSYDGVNRYDYNWIGYPWNGSYGRFPVAVAPGQSVIDHYVSNLGWGCNLYVYFSVTCDANTCIPSIRDASYGCNASSGSGTGSPLQLPMSRTVSNWTSNECALLQQRAR